MIIKEYNQVGGIYFFETFSHVTKITGVRILLTLAIKSWYLDQLDINSAFLLDNLQEEVYMTIP